MKPGRGGSNLGAGSRLRGVRAIALWLAKGVLELGRFDQDRMVAIDSASPSPTGVPEAASND